MATIGLFGGSFNPPHVAHQLVTLYVLESQDLDEVWLLPAYRHAFGKDLASFEDRMAMCQLAVAPLAPRAKVLATEAELARRPGFRASRTLHLLEALIEAHPEHRFRLIIGSDILAEADKWYRWEAVVALAPPLVIGRAGHLPPNATATELVMPEVSSTEVRQRVARQESVRNLLPREVVRYIDERGLYRDE